MKRPQIDIIKYALIATAIFTLILILVYVYRFHHGLSYNHNDFADFGSYLGSITGLNVLLKSRDPKYYYDTIYEIKGIIMSSKIHEMYRIIVASICNRICIEKRYQQLYKFIRNVGDYLYGQYGQYLGQYHRNIYYLLDSIQNFKYPNDYSKIFRAQLSSDELTVILFNSMSSQSTLKTISLLKKFDIFNNIIALELPISGYDTEKEIVIQTINSLFHEFIADSTNK